MFIPHYHIRAQIIINLACQNISYLHIVQGKSIMLAVIAIFEKLVFSLVETANEWEMFSVATV